jgi:hypothetical protein
MISTFGSLAASPLPRATLVVAGRLRLNDAGELTGPYFGNVARRSESLARSAEMVHNCCLLSPDPGRIVATRIDRLGTLNVHGSAPH